MASGLVPSMIQTDSVLPLPSTAPVESETAPLSEEPPPQAATVRLNAARPTASRPVFLVTNMCAPFRPCRIPRVEAGLYTRGLDLWSIVGRRSDRRQEPEPSGGKMSTTIR